jgi:polyhydroxyalkanoate synthesis regulator phasin
MEISSFSLNPPKEIVAKLQEEGTGQANKAIIEKIKGIIDNLIEKGTFLGEEINKVIENPDDIAQMDLQGEMDNTMKSILSNRPKTAIRTYTFPKGFWKNWKYKVKFNPTNELVNKQAFNTTSTALIQAITQDPTLLTDPVKSRVFLPLMERNGVSPTIIRDVQNAVANQPQPSQNPTALDAIKNPKALESLTKA